ncbi:MAG: hypothetical protein BA066_01550 [Candidatus Korarchaeota archaeon NZ13-K]|nr:MAG: hypothetical protein BA066_01550 [Candidatus Korarchaeota archaeon NZ13-K]
MTVQPGRYYAYPGRLPGSGCRPRALRDLSVAGGLLGQEVLQGRRGHLLPLSHGGRHIRGSDAELADTRGHIGSLRWGRLRVHIPGTIRGMRCHVHEPPRSVPPDGRRRHNGSRGQRVQHGRRRRFRGLCDIQGRAEVSGRGEEVPRGIPSRLAWHNAGGRGVRHRVGSLPKLRLSPSGDRVRHGDLAPRFGAGGGNSHRAHRHIPSRQGVEIMRRSHLAIIVLVLISPLFGVIGANIVGYREPLDVAAELIGMKESEPVWSGIFPDYTIPGLPDEIAYIVAGLVGVGVLLLPSLIRRTGK